VLRRPHQAARVHLCDREQLELERGHDPEVPAASPQRPEQIRVLVGVGAHLLAIGSYQLGRCDRVAGESVAAAQPADAAGDREADHADVGRGAAQRCEPVLAGGGPQVAAQDTRLHARPARGGIDVHPAHPLRLEQHHAVQRAQGARPVAGSVRGDAQPPLAGEVHNCGHVVGAVGERDGGGLQVGGQIPGLARRVPAVVVRGDDRTAHGGP
jgi:hypothetical protein